MQILPLRTRILAPGDDLARVIADAATLEPGDIIVISSKAVATVEGAAVDLATMKPGKKAREYARITGRDAAFMQAVLEETKRLHGTVNGTCPGALLTEVRPEGLAVGTILTANAGLDQSNVAKGFAIGWPRDPVESTRKLKEKLEGMMHFLSHNFPHPLTPSPTGEGENSDKSLPSPVGEGRSSGVGVTTATATYQSREPEEATDDVEHYIKPFINRDVLANARHMRKEPTEAEEALWEHLRLDQLGYRFRRQHPVDHYIIDFYCHDAKLGIEIDGEIHRNRDQKERDDARTEYLSNYGITILRFKNDDVFQRLPYVLNMIRNQLKNSLPPVGEGLGMGVFAGEGPGEGEKRGEGSGMGVFAGEGPGEGEKRGEGSGMGVFAGDGERSGSISLLLTDSSCRPRRLGVTAFALVAAGIDPLLSERGHKDLFGRELRITSEAVADQLATAANFLMGNADQATPAAIIRDHGLPRSNFLGWVPGIEAEDDLFRGLI